jgi:hypothetical protein
MPDLVVSHLALRLLSKCQIAVFTHCGSVLQGVLHKIYPLAFFNFHNDSETIFPDACSPKKTKSVM